MQKEAIEQTFRDTEKLIYRTVWGVQKQFGGDFDELLSDAILHFLSACQTYRQDKGSFNNHLVINISLRLRSQLRCRRRSMKNQQTQDDDKISKALSPGRWSLEEFAEGLSNDARMLLRLLFRKTETELYLLGVADNNCKIQTRVKKFLYRNGWTRKRYREVFQEIREAIDSE